MVKEEFFTAPLNYQFIGYNGCTKFLSEIVEHPHIMVAFKQVNFYSRIREFSQFAYEPYISFRHYCFVFKPEIKCITHKKSLGSICFNHIQQASEPIFPFAARSIVRGAQMKIGSKI